MYIEVEGDVERGGMGKGSEDEINEKEEWRMAYGVWRMAYGVWRVAHGVWGMACGAWRVACGVLRVA